MIKGLTEAVAKLVSKVLGDDTDEQGNLHRFDAQREAAANAFMAKAENAHRLVPRHPGTLAAQPQVLVLPGAQFVRRDPRFPHNPMILERGISKRDFYAACRGTRRDPKTNSYERPAVGQALVNALSAAWAVAHPELPRLAGKYDRTRTAWRVGDANLLKGAQS